jgi:2-isopropylmalate synthase
LAEAVSNPLAPTDKVAEEAHENGLFCCTGRLTAKVVVGREHGHAVADGDGPVNALDGALRSAPLKFYPDLQAVRLTDYKVRIVNSASGTAAVTRVLIESTDGTSTWTTIGVHENIIEAACAGRP